MLPPSAASPKSIDAQIALVDIDLIYLLQLRHDCHRTGRGVNATLGFRLRYPLHAMGTGFEFQLLVNVLALDAGDNFLVTPMFAGPFGNHL